MELCFVLVILSKLTLESGTKPFTQKDLNISKT